MNCTTAGACGVLYLPLDVVWPEGYYLEKVVAYCRNSNSLTAGAILALYTHGSNEQFNVQVGSNSSTGQTTSGSYELTVDLSGERPSFEHNVRTNFLMARIENLDQTAGASRFKLLGLELIWKRT